MLKFQAHRNLWLGLAAAAVLTGGFLFLGHYRATHQAPAQAKKANAGKPVTAKGVTAKPVAAKSVVAKKAPEPTTMVTVPKGTAISATVGQTLATDKNKVGDTFAAMLTAPIEIDGQTVIPKGAKVTGRVVKIKKHEIKVTLASVVVHGQSYDLETNSLSGSKAKVDDTATTKNVKSTDQTPVNKDVTLLTAKSQLTFKLSKPVIIPVKG
jgi:hypothetical protein